MGETDNYDCVHKLPAMAAVMDAEGRFLDVTDEFTSRLGYAREVLRGKGFQDLATPESGSGPGVVVKTSFQGRRVFLRRPCLPVV